MLVVSFHLVRVRNRAVIMSLFERILYHIYLIILAYLVANHIEVSTVHTLLECVHVDNVVILAVYVKTEGENL